jgi:hypothetical protein
LDAWGEFDAAKPLTVVSNSATPIDATDLAGNVTTTNLNITLDYSLATNPVIRLTWPTNGMQICQNSFTLRGRTEDASAVVTAQITDTNGDTNVINGTVERTGVLWLENLPLAEGTNIVTLWVTNSAGLSSETNICVVKSDMTLTLNSISGNLWLPTVDVNGSISDPTAAVWVNGVQGTNHGDGTWSASGVPVSPGSIASFDMTASPAGGDDPGARTSVKKEAAIVMESATWGSDHVFNTGSAPGEGWEVDHVEGHYTFGIGGKQTEIFEVQDTNQVTYNTFYTTWDLGPDASIEDAYWYDTMGDSGDDVDSFTIQQEEGTYTWQCTNCMLRSWKINSDVCMVLYTGGKKRDNLFQLTGSANEEYFISMIIPFDRITVAGQRLDTNGIAYGVFPDNAQVDCTPDTSAPFYGFTVGASKQCAPMRLNFSDRPWVAPYEFSNSGYTVYFTLEAVCNKDWGTNDPDTLATISWGYDVDTNGQQHQHPYATNSGCGTIIVDSFDNYNTNTSYGNNCPGVHLTAHYIGCCDDGDLNWVQHYTEYTNGVQAAANQLDTWNPPSPYYFETNEIQNFLSDYTDYEDWINGSCP